MRAAPIPTRSRSSTTTGVPPRNAPTHIALPAAPGPSSWTNTAFAAFGSSGRPGGSGSASGSPGARTPGSLPGTPSAESVALPGTPSRDNQRPVTSPTSPRSSFLPNFIQRTRARSSTLSGRRNQNPTQATANQGLSTTQSQNQGNSQMATDQPATNGSSGNGRGTPALTRSMSTPAPQHNCKLLRDTSSTVSHYTFYTISAHSPRPDAAPATTAGPARPTFRIRLVPHLETYRSLHFEPVLRDLEPCSSSDRLDGTVLKVGRFTEKQSQALQAAQQASAANAAPQRDARPGFTAGVDGDPAFNPFTYATTDGVAAAPAQPSVNGAGPTSTVLINGFPLTGDRPATGMGGGGHLTSAKVAFKSKVVSRAHAEIWCEGEGKVSMNVQRNEDRVMNLLSAQFFVKDTRSSSGTFLNHIRLSNPGMESRPFPIKVRLLECLCRFRR